MSEDIVRDFLAAATTDRLVPTPEAPFAYGVDLVCVDDLTADMQETDPNDASALAQDVLHRLSTPHGTLPDDPDYGYDIAGLLSRGVTQQTLAELQGKARQEILKDDRIADATVTVTDDSNGNFRVSVRLTVSGTDDAFTLIMAVTDGQLLLTAIQGQ